MRLLLFDLILCNSRDKCLIEKVDGLSIKIFLIRTIHIITALAQHLRLIIQTVGLMKLRLLRITAGLLKGDYNITASRPKTAI